MGRGCGGCGLTVLLGGMLVMATVWFGFLR